MRVYYLHTFSNDDGTKVRKEGQEVGQGSGRRDGREWEIVDFEAREKPSDAYFVWWVAVSNDNDLK